MKIARALLASASLLAPAAWAGEVSNVTGTLDTTLVDPAPSQYPHFICASGCSGGGGANGAVTQSGAWTVGITNFPSTQAVTGTVSIGNFPVTQAVSGTVTVGNLPVVQTVSAASLPLPAGAATAANQPALNTDGGSLSHVTNFPTSQTVNGSVSLSGTLPGFAAPPNFFVSNSSLPIAAASGGFPDGWNPTEGGTNDAAWTSGAGSIISLLKATAGSLTGMSSALVGPTPAGSNIIGKVGVDQSSPGSTNAVQLVGVPSASSTATEACHVLKSGAGYLFSVSGIAPTAEYIMVFNTASAPADGALTGVNTPVYEYQVSGPGAWGVGPPTPWSMTTGITVCASSTGGFTKTALSGNYFSGQPQ